jgi:hypothetical protein
MERGNGVRSLDVSCWKCHHLAIVNADPWPDDVPVPTFGPRMVCTRCGIIVADGGRTSVCCNAALRFRDGPQAAYRAAKNDRETFALPGMPPSAVS